MIVKSNRKIKTKKLNKGENKNESQRTETPLTITASEGHNVTDSNESKGKSSR